MRRDQVDASLRNCLDFYIPARKEIRNRLLFDDYFLGCVAVLRPEVVFKVNSHEIFVRVWKICQKLGSFDQIAIGNEWRSLNELSPEIKKQWSKLSFDEMCIAIGVFTTNKGGKMFPNLSSLLSRVRTLPHSNAEAERAFSMLTDSKTSKRNRLGIRTVNSICVTQSALRARNETARTKRITWKHFNLMDSANLYKPAVKEHSENKLTLFAWDGTDTF